MRLIAGLFKGPILGAILGGAVGFGFFKLGAGGGGFFQWITYGLVGAVAGFFCGKPLWKQSTLWTPALKAIVGFGIGIGVFALWTRVLGDPIMVPAIQQVGLMAPAKASTVPFALGAVVGLVWGSLVGLDDAIGDGDKKEGKKELPDAPQPKGKLGPGPKA
jgi:hypothetical protein